MKSLQVVLSTLRPAVVSLIATAGLTIIISAVFGGLGISIDTMKIQMVVIFGICMLLLMKWKMNPILVMVLAGVLNVFQYFIVNQLF